MKKTLILAASLAGAVGAFAQGTVNFSTFVSGTLQVAVYSPQLTGGQQTGNSPTDVPSGTTVYTGVPIGGSSSGSGPTGYGNGANFTAELYALGGGSSATPFSSLSPVTQYTANFFTVPAGAGYFREAAPGGDTGIANSAAGSAALSVAAWYNGGGTISSLSAAKSAGVPWGNSPVFVLSGLGGTGSPPATTPNLTGLTSFSLTTVPEPCTMVLGAMGAAAFLFRRRKV